MDKNAVLMLAREVQNTVPFYQDFYNGLSLDSFEAIPVLQKEHLFDYRLRTGLPYYGNLLPGYHVFRTEGTKSKPLPVPIRPAFLFEEVDRFCQGLVLPNDPNRNTHVVWIDSFFFDFY